MTILLHVALQCVQIRLLVILTLLFLIQNSDFSLEVTLALGLSVTVLL